MGVVTRKDSPYYWLNLERPGLPPLRESTKLLARGLPEPQLRENKRLAQVIYQARMGDLARERTGLPSVAGSRETLRMFADWYERHILPTHRGAEREREILPVLLDAFGALALSAVTRGKVQEWMTARAKQVNPSTVNREVDLLKTLLREAVTHKKLEASPLVGMKRLHVTRRPKIRMTVEQEDALLAAIPDARDRALLIMGLDTLARMGDLLDVRRDHDAGKTLTIVDPKNGELHEVPVSRRLRAALDAVPPCACGDKRCAKEHQPYYFAHRRKAKNRRDWASSVRQMLERACARAKVPYGRMNNALTWHAATRRTGASRMLAAKVSMDVVMKVGGWKTLEQVKDYAVPEDDALIEAVEMVGRRGKPNTP